MAFVIARSPIPSSSGVEQSWSAPENLGMIRMVTLRWGLMTAGAPGGANLQMVLFTDASLETYVSALTSWATISAGESLDGCVVFGGAFDALSETAEGVFPAITYHTVNVVPDLYLEGGETFVCREYDAAVLAGLSWGEGLAVYIYEVAEQPKPKVQKPKLSPPYRCKLVAR